MEIKSRRSPLNTAGGLFGQFGAKRSSRIHAASPLGKSDQESLNCISVHFSGLRLLAPNLFEGDATNFNFILHQALKSKIKIKDPNRQSLIVNRQSSIVNR